MKLEMNDWGELTIDLTSLGFWISRGDETDEHPRLGCRVEIDHENVFIKLTPENAERLHAALSRAQLEFEALGYSDGHTGTDFVRPR